MTATRCTHSFPDPYPQPITQHVACRHCGTTYQQAKTEAELCGVPHHQHPETLCTQPASHYQRDRDPHAGQLIINGRVCGVAVWDEPEEQP